MKDILYRRDIGNNEVNDLSLNKRHSPRGWITILASESDAFPTFSGPEPLLTLSDT